MELTLAFIKKSYIIISIQELINDSNNIHKIKRYMRQETELKEKQHK